MDHLDLSNPATRKLARRALETSFSPDELESLVRTEFGYKPANLIPWKSAYATVLSETIDRMNEAALYFGQQPGWGVARPADGLMFRTENSRAHAEGPVA